MFESIRVLQERLSPLNTLEVIHGSHVWSASFTWFPPEGEGFHNPIGQPGRTLPKDYEVFLKEISDGCLFYYDALYGQWGYRLFSSGELPGKQEYWKERLEPGWRDSFIAFAEMRGESHVLLFDMTQPSMDRSSCAILEGNPLDPVDEWYRVSRSFHEWIDHLITAQGGKYWEW